MDPSARRKRVTHVGFIFGKANLGAADQVRGTTVIPPSALIPKSEYSADAPPCPPLCPAVITLALTSPEPRGSILTPALAGSNHPPGPRVAHPTRSSRLGQPGHGPHLALCPPAICHFRGTCRSAGDGLWSENGRFPTKTSTPGKKPRGWLAHRTFPPAPSDVATDRVGPHNAETRHWKAIRRQSDFGVGRGSDSFHPSWPAGLSSFPNTLNFTCARASRARLTTVPSCPYWHSLPEVPVSPLERYHVDYEYFMTQWVGWHWASLWQGGI